MEYRDVNDIDIYEGSDWFQSKQEKWEKKEVLVTRRKAWQDPPPEAIPDNGPMRKQ